MHDWQILIVEDEPASARELRRCVETLKSSAVGIAHNLVSAREQLEALGVELVLLDLDLNETENGLELAELLQQKDIPFIVVSGKQDNYTARQVVAEKAYRNFSKPLRISDLRNALLALEDEQQKITSKPTPPTDYFFIKITNDQERNKGGKLKMRVNEIVAIRSESNYAHVHLVNGKTQLVDVSLKEMLEKMATTTGVFCRCHRQWAVNIEHVEKQVGHEVVVDGLQQNVPIGKTYKEEVVALLNSF